MVKRDELARAFSNLLHNTYEHNGDMDNQTKFVATKSVKNDFGSSNANLFVSAIPNDTSTFARVLAGRTNSVIMSQPLTRATVIDMPGTCFRCWTQRDVPRTIYLSIYLYQYDYMLTRACLYRLRLHNLYQCRACLRSGTCQMKTPDRIRTNTGSHTL